jgi:hypothetical protein
MFAGVLVLAVGFPSLVLIADEQTSHWENLEAIRRSFDDRLIPAATWVWEFATRERRLPTDDELRTYCVKAFEGDGSLLFENVRPGWTAGVWPTRILSSVILSQSGICPIVPGTDEGWKRGRIDDYVPIPARPFSLKRFRRDCTRGSLSRSLRERNDRGSGRLADMSASSAEDGQGVCGAWRLLGQELTQMQAESTHLPEWVVENLSPEARPPGEGPTRFRDG